MGSSRSTLAALASVPAAVLVLYVNVVVAGSFIESAGDLRYIVVPLALIAPALATPTIVFRRSTASGRSRGAGVARAAVASLVLSVIALPFSIGAMSM